MPVVVTCTACGKPMRIPDRYAGRRIRCRHCSAAVLVPAARPDIGPSAAPPLPPQETAAPLGPKWEQVHGGLTWSQWGAGLALFGLLASMAAQAARAARASARQDPLADLARPGEVPTWLILANLPGLAALLCFCVGRLLCCSVPEPAPARRFIAGSALATVLATLCWGVLLYQSVLAVVSQEPSGWSLLPLLGCVAAALAAEVLFLLFLGGVARFLRASRLAARVRIFAGALMVFVGVELVLVLVYVLAAPGPVRGSFAPPEPPLFAQQEPDDGPFGNDLPRPGFPQPQSPSLVVPALVAVLTTFFSLALLILYQFVLAGARTAIRDRLTV